MTKKLKLDLDLSGISDADLTLLQEEGSRGMPEYAASCGDKDAPAPAPAPGPGGERLLQEQSDNSCNQCDDACDDACNGITGGLLGGALSNSELSLF